MPRRDGTTVVTVFWLGERSGDYGVDDFDGRGLRRCELIGEVDVELLQPVQGRHGLLLQVDPPVTFADGNSSTQLAVSERTEDGDVWNQDKATLVRVYRSYEASGTYGLFRSQGWLARSPELIPPSYDEAFLQVCEELSGSLAQGLSVDELPRRLRVFVWNERSRRARGTLPDWEERKLESIPNWTWE